jgi:phospho-N-acetylmuramoyl-pentapeptide-transferase
MLYLLLFPLHLRYPAFNVLRYQTFRSVLAGLAALALSLALGPLLIQRFRAAHIGQTIREEVPQSHQKKAGTPTMGGLLILASCLVATILLADPRNAFVWIALFVMVAFGAIGFSDDYLKLRRGRGQGLSGPQKLFWQFTCAFAAAVVLFAVLKLDTHLTFPFLKRVHPNLHLVALRAASDGGDRRLLECGEPDRRPRRACDWPCDDDRLLLLDFHLRGRKFEIRHLP